jgi:Winged helix-turn-helix DNA-binding
MKTARKKRSLVSPRKRSRTALPKARSRSKSRSAAGTPSESAGPHWTFLTNHGHVLVLLSRNPSLVLRQVALHVGITERAVQRIIADFEASGIIDREKIGRQNHYRIRTDQPLRHPNESHRTIGELLALLGGAEKPLRK